MNENTSINRVEFIEKNKNGIIIRPCFVLQKLEEGYSVDLYRDNKMILEDTLCVRKVKEDGTLGEELEHGKFYTKYKYKYKYNFDGTTLHLPSCLSKDDSVLISFNSHIYDDCKSKPTKELFKIFITEEEENV